MNICNIYYVGIIWFSIIVDCIVIFFVCNFWKSPFYCSYNARFSMCTNKIISFGLFLANLVGLFCRIMSACSPQRRVRQRTEGDRVALRAKIINRLVIAERNVVQSDIMVSSLDSIHDTIQTYHWGYLHTCACVVYTMLVQLFYANLVVVQDNDRWLVLQSTVGGHTIIVDPQIISQFIGVPVLQIPGSPYNEVVIPHSLDDLREFFHAVPQGGEHATTIRIGALFAPHRMLAKIVQHNLWPVVRRSDLILKRAQFVYAISLRLPFCLCKHILGVILEAHDKGNAGLPFGCLLTQIILQSGISITSEPKMKIQDPISKQTLMKSNAQLRRDDPVMMCPYLLLFLSAYQMWHPLLKLFRHHSLMSAIPKLWRH
jgi:hypothetical protein